MAAQTTNYNLTKPSTDDFYDVGVQNGNMDIIDGVLKGMEDNKEGLIKDADVKGTIVDADTIPLSDSAAGGIKKKITFLALRTALKAFNDILYNYYIHPTGSGNNHIPVGGAATQILKWSGAGAAAWATLTKSDVGLGNVDNTSDANKPVSTATQTALNGKASSSHTHTAGDVGALPLTGGTMNGSLSIGMNFPAIILSDSASGLSGRLFETGGYTYLRTYKNESEYTQLTLGQHSQSVHDLLQLYKLGGSICRVYHEGNITISTAAPGSALAEGAQHQVY